MGIGGGDEAKAGVAGCSPHHHGPGHTQARDPETDGRAWGGTTHHSRSGGRASAAAIAAHTRAGVAGMSMCSMP